MTNIEQALKILNKDGVVAIPTETVYGLAASINSTKGIDKIFSTKERPFFDPLIVHIASIKEAQSYSSNWNQECDKLANTFWPGPLTLILPKNNMISDKITSGLETVGLRIPNHSLTLELIRKLGHPVAAPSANKFTKTSPTSAQHVQTEFPEVFTLDGGTCEIGIESTIVGFENNAAVIYRPGMISASEIEKCLGYEIMTKESPVAPGHLKHHYMPKKPIIALLDEVDEQALSEFCPPDVLEQIYYWSLPNDPVMAARVLYAKFREFDHKEISAIGIKFTQEQRSNVQYSGIFNRLFKAASYILPKEIAHNP